MICPETQLPCPRLMELAVDGEETEEQEVGEFPHNFDLVIEDGAGERTVPLLPLSTTDLIETFALRSGAVCSNNTTGECGIIEAVYKGLSGIRGNE